MPARALMRERGLLLLDEAARAAVREGVVALERAWQVPFILLTHDRREAKTLGEMIIHLDRGKQRLECLLTGAKVHRVEVGRGDVCCGS